MTVYSDLYERLFHFFRNDPHTLKLLTVLSDPIQDTSDAMSFLLASDAIDTAEGEQLDIIAGWIGINRPPAQETNIFTLRRLGYTGDLENNTGFEDTTDTVELGGYMTTLTGLQSQSDSTAKMPDTDFRRFIRQKASVFYSKMTVENLFLYLIAFGSKCLIDDDTQFIVEIDPFSYYDLDAWFKNYVVTNGFKPAGFTVQFRDNMRHEDSI